MKLVDIYNKFQKDIAIIEAELESSLQSKNAVLSEATTQLLKAGGKRLRPIVVLLAGQFGDYNIHTLKNIAVPLELIHMGSLVHDDVIDDAELRRGKKTVKSQWDNRVAMYTGDFIFAKALEVCSSIDNPKVHQILAKAMVEMCIGEVEQIRDQYNWNQNLKIYLRRIKRKTALLIATSCKLGAMGANASPFVWNRLYHFGYYLGMSFQITDDILDFISTEQELGKPAGSDLQQGNITLPALFAMDHDAQLKRQIMEILDEPYVKQSEMKEIIEKINNSGGIEYSIEMSDRYLSKAFVCLEEFPNIDAKNDFLELANFIGTRKF